MSERPEAMLPVVTVICCREWPVVPVMGWGHCKLCGAKPVYLRPAGMVPVRGPIRIETPEDEE